MAELTILGLLIYVGLKINAGMLFYVFLATAAVYKAVITVVKVREARRRAAEDAVKALLTAIGMPDDIDDIMIDIKEKEEKDDEEQ